MEFCPPIFPHWYIVTKTLKVPIHIVPSLSSRFLSCCCVFSCFVLLWLHCEVYLSGARVSPLLNRLALAVPGWWAGQGYSAELCCIVSSQRGLCDDPSSQTSTKTAVRTGPLQARNSERLQVQHIIAKDTCHCFASSDHPASKALIYMYQGIFFNWPFVVFSPRLLALTSIVLWKVEITQKWKLW